MIFSCFVPGGVASAMLEVGGIFPRALLAALQEAEQKAEAEEAEEAEAAENFASSASSASGGGGREGGGRSWRSRPVDAAQLGLRGRAEPQE